MAQTRILNDTNWSDRFKSLFYSLEKRPVLLETKYHYTGQISGIRPVSLQIGKGNVIEAWNEVYDAVRAGGHQYCSLIRDNWACSGERYINMLRQTQPYQAETFSLSRVKPNTKIFLQGNSLFGEVIFPTLCQNDTITFKLKKFQNSHLAYVPESNVTVILSCNGDPSEEYIKLMVKNSWIPDLIVLSDLNGPMNYTQPMKDYGYDWVQIYSKVFPTARIVQYYQSAFSTRKHAPRNLLAVVLAVIINAYQGQSCDNLKSLFKMCFSIYHQWIFHPHPNHHHHLYHLFFGMMKIAKDSSVRCDQ